jgi:pimeloyl-ACP methyl ester carboxylesterase
MAVKSRSDGVLYEEVRPGLRLAFRQDGPEDDGSAVGLFWLGGFMSDMMGAKAEALAATGLPLLRFDYSGHGASEGVFTDGTISLWLAEALHMFRRHTRGPRVVVGSSMGGWLAALMLRALGEEARRVAGLVLIAPAFDMTGALIWEALPPEACAAIVRDGVWYRPSAYGSPYPITRDLIEDGSKHFMLGGKLAVSCPVRVLQGDADPDVPWAHGRKVYDCIEGEDVRFILVKGGDHRLSTPRDLALLKATVLEVAGQGR